MALVADRRDAAPLNQLLVADYLLRGNVERGRELGRDIVGCGGAQQPVASHCKRWRREAQSLTQKPHRGPYGRGLSLRQLSEEGSSTDYCTGAAARNGDAVGGLTRHGHLLLRQRNTVSAIQVIGYESAELATNTAPDANPGHYHSKLTPEISDRPWVGPRALVFLTHPAGFDQNSSQSWLIHQPSCKSLRYRLRAQVAAVEITAANRFEYRHTVVVAGTWGNRLRPRLVVGAGNCR